MKIQALTLVAFALGTGCFAETVLMKSDFQNCTVGEQVPAKRPARGEIVALPTSVAVADNETATVAENVPGITGKVIRIDSQTNRNRKPEVFFDGGNNLVSGEKMTVKWISMVESCSAPERGVETGFTIKLIGNSGVPLLFLMYGVRDETGGFLATLGGEKTNMNWEVGKPNQFVLTIDLAAGTYDLTVDGIEVNKGAKLDRNPGTFRGIYLTDGASVGGQEGKFRACFGNLVVEKP